MVSTGTGAESMGGRGSKGKWGSAPMDLHFTDRQYVEKVVDPWRADPSVLTPVGSSRMGFFQNGALPKQGSS